MTGGARLESFRGVRYGEPAGDPADLLAPPYDVIDDAEARELRGRSPFNAVRLVLPEGDAPARYALAARRLREWAADGVLVRDPEPSLYVYAQSFRHGGRKLTRRGLFGALRLSGFTEGEVVPHEETHRGPKEDRLALMRATGAQLSPVFLVAPDAGGGESSPIGRAARGTPDVDARTPDGVRHRLWRVPEGPPAAELRQAAAAGPLLVADGHHRYETALELARGTPRDHPARRILACVVGASDPGLLCLPTHRALGRPPGERVPGEGGGGASAATPPSGEEAGAAAWRAFLEEAFTTRELDLSPPDGALEGDVAASAAAARAARAAEEAGSGALAAVAAGGTGDAPRGWLLRPRGGEAGGGPAPAAFDRLVLRRGFGVGPDPAVERGLLSYHREADAALAAAGRDGAAFLLPPPDVDAVREAAGRGERLPPKSTYFWPKLPSGLLFRALSG